MRRKTKSKDRRWHGRLDAEIVSELGRRKQFDVSLVREVEYRFDLHQHPYVQKLMSSLLRRGTAGLQASDTQYQQENGSWKPYPDGPGFLPELYEAFFETAYSPNSEVVREPYPVKDLDFASRGAYSVYNWELFFHVPMTIALHLSKNQRFAEAQRWFHFIFDPTDDGEGPTPERFWKVRPFHSAEVRRVEEILVNLVTGEDQELRDETIHSINAWKDAPFRPHVIARHRRQAYMYKTVMSYLDNLIAWGDALFRQDTGEAIDEALQLYVLAANILGPRPLGVPRKGTVRPQTYANLRADLRDFGTVMRDLEADIPFDVTPHPTGRGLSRRGDEERLKTLRSLGKALYFCVPRNDKLLGYWDTTADRLFKIRNSLNLQGVFRRLALFEPPIDPAMLARAAAAGVDVGAAVNDLNRPLPLVRFRVLARRAAEACAEVKSLGGGLLAALEREDGEALAILRARHEREAMELVEKITYGRLQEAVKAKEGFLDSLSTAIGRYAFYERQLGRESEEIERSVPEIDDLDQEALETMKAVFREPTMILREIGFDLAEGDVQAAGGARGGKLLSSYEAQEMVLLEQAQSANDAASALSTAGSIAALLPQLGVEFAFWGVGGNLRFGGQQLGMALQAGANAARGRGERLNFEARRASRMDVLARREREWAFQSNLAAGEITQILKQLRVAQIREAVAEQELRSHRRQMRHAEEIEDFLNEEGAGDGKVTNQAFYAWMKRESKGLHARAFQFAYDLAKKAERALQHELGDSTLQYVRGGYLSGREGLLAGEKLHLDLQRMEAAYDDLNRREYELTKHVSLLQVDPLALLTLRTTGRCVVELPEALFDMDGPGHYFRRLRTAALSIPCVTGPYASVNCTLTLLESSIRTSANASGDYARTSPEDDRFSDHLGSVRTIVTSNARSDHGLFEADLRDDRILPFEYSGVISKWELRLPADPSAGEPCQFDYETISDVILHLGYTAREGGDVLRRGALQHLTDRIAAAEAAGSVRLFSVRHDFPTEWARFQSSEAVDRRRFELSLKLRPEHFPFWSRGRLKHFTRVELLARSNKANVPGAFETADRAQRGDATAAIDELVKDAALGDLLRGPLSNIALPAVPTSEPDSGIFRLFLDDNTLSDLWIAVTWAENPAPNP